MDLEEIFTSAGFEVVGTASSVEEAFEKIRTTQPEVVTLDLNLMGTRSYPVADCLLAEGIPFVFCTGYFGTERFPDRHKNVPVLPKPVHSVDAVKTVRTLLGVHRNRAPADVEAA
jgi:DNA-binding NarL/FixJ family response regulator